MTVQLITANHAAGAAATLAARANRTARGFGGGVYPITPQTECIEFLCAQDIEKGHVVRVESEHSAMGVCIGFSVAGARSFTASSSNGLAYMVENVYVAGYFRLPIVMMAVNRTLGPPWNIWVDHTDTLMLRDSGWIQLYCEDNQEVADSIFMAYRLAVAAGLFGVYEIIDGVETRINVEPELSETALRRYFDLQGRYTRGEIDLTSAAASIRARWRVLRRQAETVHAD